MLHPSIQGYGLAKMVMVNITVNERGPNELIFTVGYFVEQVASVEEIVRLKLKQPGQ